MKLGCRNCNREADTKDILIARMHLSPGEDWFCSKGCWEQHTAKHGEPLTEGEHYGVVYGSIKEDSQ